MSTMQHHDKNHEHDQMLSIAEAATFLRVPVATMRYWRYCGDGPHSFRLGRHVRYWHTDLVLWRADQDQRIEPSNPQAPRR